jgi:pimeloyl-ACP methyl ester carboxylesterase
VTDGAARSIALGDGRRLAYAEYGDPAGIPVLWFHGAPSSRFEPLLIGDDALRAHGLRVIAPDRPGMGASDFQPRRAFDDWPGDVASLADALGLQRFAVIGFSGGGPYVAACAARIPERITRAVVVSGGWNMNWPEAREGIPWPNRLLFTLSRRAPWLLAAMLKLMVAMSKDGDPAKDLEELRKRVPAPDFEALREPFRMKAMNRIIRGSVQQGTAGPVHDLALYAREFTLRPEDARMPVAFFHGERDANAPIGLARKVSGAMPGATLAAYPREAHMSMLCARFDDIAPALR